MPSMFERDAKKVVKELGKRDLIPVQSLLTSPRFHPFCLIRKKEKKFPWFFEPTFLDTYFSLMDILEPSSSVPEVTSSKPLHFYETEYTELQGNMDLNVTREVQGKVTGATTSSHNLALKLQILTVVPQIWETLMERKVKSKHSFLQEVQNRGEKLYVVAEAVEIIEDTILMQSNKNEGSIQASLGQLSSLPGINFKGEGKGQTDGKKGVSVNQGYIVAFRALELFIHNDKWMEEFYIDRLTGKHIYAPTNFEEFQEMMIREQEALLKGSRELRVTLLHVIQNILGNRKALHDLEDMLDQVPDMREKGQLEGPGVCILKHLQDNSGDASNQQTESILYFLGALMILTDTQQELLAQSLEKRILPQQLELVRKPRETTILERVMRSQGRERRRVIEEMMAGGANFKSS
ncbi:gasdermin-C-like [Monodelphis domestica]|uniref:gasdermin-C-like n=1 Tax=Monodelphis domestica TaxID=13616 RepID=UPI0024E23C90|nr:gasdermin-C-like [Monodelphis domestica]